MVEGSNFLYLPAGVQQAAALSCTPTTTTRRQRRCSNRLPVMRALSDSSVSTASCPSSSGVSSTDTTPEKTPEKLADWAELVLAESEENDENSQQAQSAEAWSRNIFEVMNTMGPLQLSPASPPAAQPQPSAVSARTDGSGDNGSTSSSSRAIPPTPPVPSRLPRLAHLVGGLQGARPRKNPKPQRVLRSPDHGDGVSSGSGSSKTSSGELYQPPKTRGRGFKAFQALKGRM